MDHIAVVQQVVVPPAVAGPPVTPHDSQLFMHVLSCVMTRMGQAQQHPLIDWRLKRGAKAERRPARGAVRVPTPLTCR